MEVNIIEELAKATETKTESSAQLPRFNFNLDDEPIQTQPTSATENKPQQAPENNQAPQTEIKKITNEDAAISGETAAALLDTVTNGLASLAIHLQTKYKFTEAERERIEDSDILDITDDKLNNEDKRLKNKWRRIMKKAEKKLDSLETDDKDSERRAKIFSKYFKATGKELSPGWLLAAALIEDIGGKLETIFLE